MKRIKLEQPEFGECSGLQMSSATSTSSMISKHFVSQTNQPMMIVSNGNNNERFQQQNQPTKTFNQTKMHSFNKQPQTQYVNIQKPATKQNVNNNNNNNNNNSNNNNINKKSSRKI